MKRKRRVWRRRKDGVSQRYAVIENKRKANVGLAGRYWLGQKTGKSDEYLNKLKRKIGENNEVISFQEEEIKNE